MHENEQPGSASRTQDFAGVPLTSGVARRIIVELLQRQLQWRRKDLAVEVERIHMARGGTKGQQSPQSIVKKALTDLLEDGLVENFGFGLWRSTSLAGDVQKASDEGTLLPDQLSDAEPIEEVIEGKTIGDGAEAVYVYFNPNDRELATLRGRDTWECKVGRSSSANPVDRIMGQGAKTALSHPPVVGLVILTNDSSALEKAIHASLRLVEQRVDDSPGAEWFLTSPARIEAWYLGYQLAVAHLAGDTSSDAP
jgi:hypothetical protein